MAIPSAVPSHRLEVWEKNHASAQIDDPRESHIGWVFLPESNATDEQTVKDLIRYFELCRLDHYNWLPTSHWPGCASLKMLAL